MEAQSAQSVDRVGVLYVMKSRPLRDEPSDSLFKSKDSAGQQKDMFQEVRLIFNKQTNTTHTWIQRWKYFY